MKKIALALASIALVLIPASAQADHHHRDGRPTVSTNRIDWD